MKSVASWVVTGTKGFITWSRGIALKYMYPKYARYTFNAFKIS